MTGTKPDNLQRVVTDFNHNLRWKYNQAAVAAVDPKHAEDLLDELEKIKEDLNIDDFEVRKVELAPQGTRAVIRVFFSYYRIPSTVVKKETAEQTWEKISDRWWLMSQKNGPFEFPPKQPDPSPAPPLPR